MAPLRDLSIGNSTIVSFGTTVVAFFTFAVVFFVCSCCRRKKKSEEEEAARKLAIAERAAKKDLASPPAPPAQPREPLAVDHISTSCFGFGVNVYRWCSGIHLRKTIFAFPSALQASFGPYFEASKRLTRSQFRTALFPTLSEKDADDALIAVTTGISPITVDGPARGWRVATRLYALTKRMEAYCPEYRQHFDALNDRGGKVMEMVGFEAKDAGPYVDDLNMWAKRNVNFMERPLFENAEKKKNTFFVNKTDPRLVLVNVCGFRCQMEHPFKAANVSTRGHPFLSYDGRKQIPNVAMMHNSEEDERTHQYFYLEDNEFQLLRLPLKKSAQSDSELAVYIFLPKEKGSLRILENKFTSQYFTSRISKCVQPEYVRMVLPKLSLECRYADLAVAMKGFGASALTDPIKAELATMYAARFYDDDGPDAKIGSKTPALGKKCQIKAKIVKGKPVMTHATENPCLTDVIHAGCFMFVDDEAEKMSILKESVKTTKPKLNLRSPDGSIPSKTVSIEKSLASKTVDVTIASTTAETSKSTIGSKRSTIGSLPSSSKASPSGTIPSASKPSTIGSASDSGSKSVEKPPSPTTPKRKSFFDRFSFSGKSKSGKNGTDEKSGKSGKEASGKSGKGASGKSGKEASGKSGKEASGKSGKEASGKSGKEASGKSGKEASGKSEKEASGKSGKSGKEASGKDGKSGKGSMRGADHKKSGKAEPEGPCPVCARLESHGLHPRLRRFVADHPFVWIVAIEKPVLLPLVMGRFCAQQ